MESPLIWWVYEQGPPGKARRRRRSCSPSRAKPGSSPARAGGGKAAGLPVAPRCHQRGRLVDGRGRRSQHSEVADCQRPAGRRSSETHRPEKPRSPRDTGGSRGCLQGSLGVQEDALPRSLLFLGYPWGVAEGGRGGSFQDPSASSGVSGVSWGVFWEEASGGLEGGTRP
ncbi:MAG: hypothetical protein QXR62_06325, partial [Candidatus Bathyarchaeia archaeon]